MRYIHYFQLQTKWGRPVSIYVETDKYDLLQSKVDGKQYRIYKEFKVPEKDIDYMPRLTPMSYFKTSTGTTIGELNYLNEILFK